MAKSRDARGRKIAKLHDGGLASRSFAKAMKDEEYRALMGRLLITPLTTHARTICRAIASEILNRRKVGLLVAS